MLNLQELLTMAIQNGASDVHIVAHQPPLFRIHTHLAPLDGYGPMSPEEVESIAKGMLGDTRWRKLNENGDMDFSVEVRGQGRFRVNAHFQRETVAIAFRAISDEVPSLENLNLPQVVSQFVDLPRGLVLVTGQTGSGKSTTLASMIEIGRAHV